MFITFGTVEFSMFGQGIYFLCAENAMRMSTTKTVCLFGAGQILILRHFQNQPRQPLTGSEFRMQSDNSE